MEKFNLIPKYSIEYKRDGTTFYATIFEENESAALHKFKEYYLYDLIVDIVLESNKTVLEISN